MKLSTTSIDIQASLPEVFAFVTDWQNLEQIFPHISDVKPLAPPTGTIPQHFQQTRHLHGQQWQETLSVIALETNKAYTLRMLIFGIETYYTYHFSARADGTTHLDLEREYHGKYLYKLLYPLVRHVLTKPEHDGNHLNTLKQAIEQQEQAAP